MHRSATIATTELIIRRRTCRKGQSKGQRRRHQNETASDIRICRLCFCTRTNYIGVGHARSNTSHAGQHRCDNRSGQRRPRAWTWVGPSRRSRPPLRLVPRPPLWLAASSPLVVTFTSRRKGRGYVSWRRSMSPIKDVPGSVADRGYYQISGSATFRCSKCV
jgi:hypothetical protein